MKIIADAGPLLHLFWTGASSWALPPQRIDVVNAVWEEVAFHAPQALDDVRLYRIMAAISASHDIAQWHLDLGEKEALSYALAQKPDHELLVLCDERQARQACKALSLPVVGSIGLIVEACRAGRTSIKSASDALRALPHSGRLHVKPDLIDQVLAALAQSQTK